MCNRDELFTTSAVMSLIPVDLFNLSRLIACATSEMSIGSVKHRGASAWVSFSARFSPVLSTFPITGFSSDSKLFYYNPKLKENKSLEIAFCLNSKA